MKAEKSFFILSLIVLITSISAPAVTNEYKIIYVDANTIGANDGTSWENAYNCLQDALADANISVGYDQIWVAVGTYKPDCNSTNPNGSGDCEAAFALIGDAALYGGFPTGGGAWESRDIDSYETVLSGDIGNIGENYDNSYHVVTAIDVDETAVLDGFTVTGGNANDFSNYYHGGGMYNYQASPTVANCTFTGNLATHNGGGMYNGSNSSPTVTNCTFSENSASAVGGLYSGGSGGGMYNDSNSNPTVTNCTFSENSALSGDYSGGSGGGMCNDSNSNPTVTNCIFRSNMASGGWERGGGGMFNGCNSNSIVNNCTFSENSSSSGGGMYNDSNSSPTVANCTFSKNTGGSCGDGGSGMCNHQASPVVTNCTFSENSTNLGYCSGSGGGMRNEYSRPTVSSCTFSKNSAGSGGGMANWHSSPDVKNCTFSENSDSGMNNCGGSPNISSCAFSRNSAFNGAGMYNEDSDANITNCVFSGNSAEDEYHLCGGAMYNRGGSLTITSCAFTENSAYTFGGSTSGAMFNESCSPTVTNCIFIANLAYTDYLNIENAGAGGAMYNSSAEPNLVNCTFVGNRAFGENGEEEDRFGTGGAIYNYYGCWPTITNCTFSGNFAYAPYGRHGGGICYAGGLSGTITNCILWGNDGNQIYANGIIWKPGEQPNRINYTNIQGGWPWPGEGIIDKDPCFVGLGYWHPYGTPDDVNDDFWVNGNYRLLPVSPCIDSGDNNSVPPDYADLDNDGNTTEPTPLDLDYFPRFIDGNSNGSDIVDMGAYEFPSDICVHIGDFDNSCHVDFKDFAIFALAWSETGDFRWISDCDISLPADGVIDEKDLQIFSENWLAGVE